MLPSYFDFEYKERNCNLCGGEVSFVMNAKIFCGSQDELMLESAFLDGLLSVEIVRKWKKKDVLDFLQENKEKEDLDIEPVDIKIIEDKQSRWYCLLNKSLLILLTIFLADWLEP